MATTAPTPFDIRLMNFTATLVFVLFALTLVGAGAWWVLRQPFFPIAALKVDGEVTHNSAVTLRATVTPQITGNFFTADLARARTAFESVPWVRQAVVRREFPNKLRATLVEHVPVAHWGADTGAQMVNGFGEIFDADAGEIDDKLPRLDGPPEQAGQVLGMYRMMVPLFAPYEIGIEELGLSSRGSWHVVLDTGALIELGRGRSEEVAARTERFLRTVAQVAAQYGRTVASIEGADLRHHEGYALRMRGVTTVVTEPPKKK
jgi:cell division protein FtsQ